MLPSPSRDVSAQRCQRRLADLLAQRPAQRRRVLVVGCGDGSFGYGPLAEVLSDGESGLLFPPRDRDALVAAVLRLIDHPAQRRALGQAAAVRARAALSWEHNAERVLAVCETAVARAAPRAARRGAVTA